VVRPRLPPVPDIPKNTKVSATLQRELNFGASTCCYALFALDCSRENI